MVFYISSIKYYSFLKSVVYMINQVHFVEMDPWVVSDVLRPNLEETGFLDASVIHTVRVEKFFERAEQFVGMCIFSFQFHFMRIFVVGLGVKQTEL